MRWGAVVLALSAPSVFASAVAVAQTPEERLEQGRRALAPFDEYFVRDGGRWTTPNADHERGDDLPPHYGLEFARRLGGWGITTRIFGIREDGAEVDYWELVTAWDAAAGEVVVHQFGRGGALMTGTGHVNADGTLEVELHGTGWDGAPTSYKDVFHIRGPDQFVIDAYHPGKDGAMMLRVSNTWSRQPGEGGSR